MWDEVQDVLDEDVPFSADDVDKIQESKDAFDVLFKKEDGIFRRPMIGTFSDDFGAVRILTGSHGVGIAVFAICSTRPLTL
jgi:hypothetical protein